MMAFHKFGYLRSLLTSTIRHGQFSHLEDFLLRSSLRVEGGPPVLVTILNVPGHVLFLHPGNKFLVIFKVVPLSSRNFIRTSGRFTPRDPLTIPPTGP